jgi:redox-sensitive bicupin YhaK (pirin superfamily)
MAPVFGAAGILASYTGKNEPSEPIDLARARSGDRFVVSRAGEALRYASYRSKSQIPVETITYVLAGAVEYGDGIGNRGAIAAGEIQWMTAGRGIIHQEMPKGKLAWA